jgi:hypothetical protein
MTKRILIVNPSAILKSLFKDCLSEGTDYSIKVCEDCLHLSDEKLNTVENFDILVIDGYFQKQNVSKIIALLSTKKIKKIIFFYNAYDVYLNSKNRLPYSVFQKLKPKNKCCKDCLELEDFIIQHFPNYAIFRVSEIYGPHILEGLIYKIFQQNTVTLNNGRYDFIYEGDFIHALEISLKEEVTGLYDLVYGESVNLKKELVPIVKDLKKNKQLNILWRGKKIKFICECRNFKFYKWEPLVNLKTGLYAMNHLKK